MAPLRIISQQDWIQIQYYIFKLNLTVRQISILTGYQEDTLWKYLKEFKIKVRKKYSTLTADELYRMIREMVTENGRLGTRMIDGKLQALGFTVQRIRIRTALNSVLGREAQSKRRIRRRKYSVRAPLAMIHIDGYMKLIRWGMPIHGGICGFSRLGFYLQVSLDNTADTVLKHFLHGAEQYGLPSRVRSDKGGENIQVARFMVLNRGVNRASHITGLSVHNQRIERWWVDVWHSCVSVYYGIFMDLEEQNVLNPGSDVDIYCLLICFLHLVQQDLDLFRESWNRHKIRTAGNMSPYQLYITGLHNLSSYGQRCGHDFTELKQPEEWNYPERSDRFQHQPPAVNIPVRRCPLKTEDDYELRQRFNQYTIDKGNALNQYLILRDIVFGMLSTYQ